MRAIKYPPLLRYLNVADPVGCLDKGSPCSADPLGGRRAGRSSTGYTGSSTCSGIPFVRAGKPGDVPIETDNVARLPPVISRPIARERALLDDNTSFSFSSLCVASLNLLLFSIVSRVMVDSFSSEVSLELGLLTIVCAGFLFKSFISECSTNTQKDGNMES